MLFQPSKGLRFWSILYREDLISQSAIVEFLVKENYLIRQESYLPQAEYYSKEMGEYANLRKFFLISLAPVKREQLLQEKLKAVKIEQEHSVINQDSCARKVNIDPGLVTLENVLLTSGKNYGHRVYMLDGVYYELELIYTKNSFEKLPWTYPDYQTPEVLEFFKSMRFQLTQILS